MYPGLSDIDALKVGSDPSWACAYQLVDQKIQIQNHVWKLFQNAWYGQAEPKDFFKVMGFSRLNPACLVHAAELGSDSSAINAELVERAIMTMGMRLSAVVLAINHFCRSILGSTPPPNLSQALLQEMINNVEIGYRLGSKSFELGVEGGALIGFATLAGELVLMAQDPKKFKAWYQAVKSNKAPTRRVTQGVFGCEPFQVSALCLQTLGFGAEAAIGVACAGGKLDCTALELHPESLRWISAYLWIEALRDGRSYPAKMKMRSQFPELIPPQPGQTKNVVLEALHTEVSKIRSASSSWRWHLP